MSTQSDKTILVTGATGFLGSYLVRYLVREGFSNIRCTRLEGDPLDLVYEEANKVQWVQGDLTDIIFLEEALEGIQQVYHCAGLISFNARDRSKLLKVNYEASKNLADLSLHTGVEKILHISSVAALGRVDKKEISEKNEWEWNNKVSNYAISKFLGEREMWRAYAEGLKVVILNPSKVLGCGFWNEGWQQLFKNAWAERSVFPLGHSGFVDVRDVAKAAIKLMNSDINGQRYILSADNLSYLDITKQMAEHFQKTPPHIALTPLLRETIWRISLFSANNTFYSKELLRHFGNSSTLYPPSSVANIFLKFLRSSKPIL